MSNQQQGGYYNNQANQQQNQLNQMSRMQQPGGSTPNYGQNISYSQMMGQPAPQISNITALTQPRSPLIQNLQAQGSTTGQPSPLAHGPLSHPSHSTGGPASVLGLGGSHSAGPASVLSNIAPHSVGPASAGEYNIGNPQSIQTQQPRMDDPRSVGPQSVNQPATPMNPASAQMPTSHTPATPAQGTKQDVENTLLTATDPVSFAKVLILKDLRHSIIRFNSCVADYMKERRGEGTKPINETKKEFQDTLDTLLAVMDDAENSLAASLEAGQQSLRLEKTYDIKEKQESPMHYAILHKEKTQTWALSFLDELEKARKIENEKKNQVVHIEDSNIVQSQEPMVS